MACYRPVLVRIRDGAKQAMPCGRCVGCDLERSRQWAVRCMHEAQMHEDNCFVTLTYDGDHLPPGGSLDREAFPAFIKRLRSSRRWYDDHTRQYIYPKIRYFHAGEYGDRNGRPHYHACLFGVDFPDKYHWTTRGEFPVWRSPTLEKLWPLGQSEIGTVTFESAAYVARYILKKIRGKTEADQAAFEAAYGYVDEDGALAFREPEYATMSRRPGIGAEWLKRYVDDVYTHDELIMRGEKMRPPRYYDKLLATLDPTRAEAVCFARARRERDLEEVTARRLKVREAVTLARINLTRKRVCE